MRVTSPLAQFGVPAVKLKRSGESEDGPFVLEEEAGKGEQLSNAGASRANGLGSLIAAQLHIVEEKELLDERQRRRRRGIESGKTILDSLEEIKLALLAGNLPPGQAAKLLAAVEGRQDSGDEQLEDLLKQIDLRAKVELAKLQQHGGS